MARCVTFTPIAGVASVPNVRMMHAQTAAPVGIANVAGLVAQARAKLGRRNDGAGGNGSARHLAGQRFKAQAGVFMVHIPTADGDPAPLALPALLSGQVELNSDPLAAASANIRCSKLRAIAVTTAAPAGAMPEGPTMAESRGSLGLAHFDIHTWFGLFGAAKLPADVTQRLNQAYRDALDPPGLKARLSGPMAERMASTPAQLGAFVKSELATYEAVVKASGATLG